ncbi:MAG: GspH/FimT family pseudopilin, partial [Pseudomonadota bacterium]
MKISSQCGFTLVELVTVLLIVSVISVTAVVSWPGEGISLSAQADQLLGDIRYAQSLAMHRGQRYRINFAGDRYWLSDESGSTVYAHPVVGSTNVMLGSGISLSSTNGSLIFNTAGVPYSSTSTPLATIAVLTLSAGGESVSVRVSPGTGRVIK